MAALRTASRAATSTWSRVPRAASSLGSAGEARPWRGRTAAPSSRWTTSWADALRPAAASVVRGLRLLLGDELQQRGLAFASLRNAPLDRGNDLVGRGHALAVAAEGLRH